MTTSTEAIYINGVLKPLGALGLREQERVRLIVERLENPDPQAREAAFQELLDGIERMNFRSEGFYPTRDQLHDRRSSVLRVDS